MLDRKINRIKLYYFLAAGAIVFLMFAGMLNFRNNPYFSQSYVKSYMTNWKYRFEFAKMNGITLASSYFNPAAKSTYTASSTLPTATAIPVLVYHGVLLKTDNSKYNVTTEQFKNQIFALKQAGYETITANDLLRYMRGEIVLPQKSILLTFDDGRKDTYYNGDPILKTVGFNSVMFIISHFTIEEDGSSYYLSSEEIKQMEASGRWDMQAHTYNGHGQVTIDSLGHQAPFFGNKIWLAEQNRLETDQEYAERIADDLSTVKIQLENTLKKKIFAFAFPFGDFGLDFSNYPNATPVLLDHASSLYPLLFFQHGAGVRFNENYFKQSSAANTSYMIRRMDIDPNWSGADIVKKLEKADAKPLPYTDAFAADNGWIQSWGITTINGAGTLVLSPEEANAGAATVLDGTGGWKDYTVNATINAQDQNGAYMWVRFQDDDNTAACNFGNGFAHIEQVINGTNKVIQGKVGPDIVIPKGDFQITARVQGRHIECILNGSVSISTDFLDPKLEQGGIGFKTWNHDHGGNNLTVKKIEVSEAAKEPSRGVPVTSLGNDTQG